MRRGSGLGTSHAALAFLRALRHLAWAALAAFALAGLVIGLLPASEELPWAPLALDRPISRTTGARIADLDGQPAACRALLARAGVAFRRLPPRDRAGDCPLTDAVSWTRGGTRAARYSPASPTLACPLAAALVVWERQVVEPEAARLLGTRVTGIDHFGSFACRRIYGRDAGPWSEHARAAAIDVAGFRLGDGRRVTVARDWQGTDAKARFLHAVRGGGCRLFATTLSPDYNAAHRDHLHLDEAARGRWWRTCR